MGRGSSKAGASSVSWKSARNAEIDTRQREIQKMISELPPLEGTEKQVSWATDIRRKTFEFLQKRYEMYVSDVEKVAEEFDSSRESLYSNYEKTGNERSLKIAKSYPKGKEQWEAAKKKAIVAHGADLDRVNRTIDKLVAKFKTITSAKFIIEHRDELSYERLRNRT